jgi:hypothetical protein
MIKQQNIFKEKIDKFKNIINELINKLNYVINNMEIYYTISSDIINNFDKKYINFSILHNIKEFYRYNEIIIKDLNKIISEKSIEDIMNIYLKLNNKTENIIGNKLNINKHFEFKENNRYQKQINNFFKTKSEIIKKK